MILSFDDGTHTLLKATASLAGFQRLEDYARDAVLKRLEGDREACRTAMTKAAIRKSRETPAANDGQLTFSES